MSEKHSMKKTVSSTYVDFVNLNYRHNIIQFPQETYIDEPFPVTDDLIPEGPGVFEAGTLTFDTMTFAIDEQDPLLYLEGHHLQDVAPRPAPRISLVENKAKEITRSRFRITDVEPLDLMLLAGFMALISYLV